MLTVIKVHILRLVNISTFGARINPRRGHTNVEILRYSTDSDYY